MDNCPQKQRDLVHVTHFGILLSLYIFGTAKDSNSVFRAHIDYNMCEASHDKLPPGVVGLHDLISGVRRNLQVEGHNAGAKRRPKFFGCAPSLFYCTPT